MSESQTQYTVDQVLEAVVRNGGSRVKAAAELGCPVRTVFKKLALAKKRGMEVPLPPGFAPSTDHIVELTQPAHEAAPEEQLQNISS